MDQYPGRALGRSRSLASSRRCAAGKARVGAGDTGLLGAERHLRWLDLFHVLFGDARRLPRTRARALPCRGTVPSPAGPFVDMGLPLLLGMGFEYIDPMVFDDPVTGKRLLYWGRASSRSRSRSWLRIACPSCRTASQSTSSGPIPSRAPSPGWLKPPGSSATTTIITSSTQATIAAGRTPNMA